MGERTMVGQGSTNGFSGLYEDALLASRMHLDKAAKDIETLKDLSNRMAPATLQVAMRQTEILIMAGEAYALLAQAAKKGPL